MFVLKLILLLIPAGIGLWEIWSAIHKPRASKETKRNGWIKLVASAIAVISSVLLAVNDERETKELRAEEESWKTQTSTQLEKIGAKTGDEDALQLYNRRMKAAASELNRATTPIKRFWDQQDLRQAQREEVLEINKKALAKHLLRVNPVRDFVVGRFDTWLGEVVKVGTKVTVETNDVPPLRIEGDAPKDGFERTATFPNGEKLYIKTSQGVIARGDLISDFWIEIHVVVRGIIGDVWNVRITNAAYHVPRARQHFSYREYSGNQSDPFADSAYIKAIQDSFDQVMIYLLDEVGVSRPK